MSVSYLTDAPPQYDLFASKLTTGQTVGAPQQDANNPTFADGFEIVDLTINATDVGQSTTAFVVPANHTGSGLVLNVNASQAIAAGTLVPFTVSFPNLATDVVFPFMSVDRANGSAQFALEIRYAGRNANLFQFRYISTAGNIDAQGTKIYLWFIKTV